MLVVSVSRNKFSIYFFISYEYSTVNGRKMSQLGPSFGSSLLSFGGLYTQNCKKFFYIHISHARMIGKTSHIFMRFNADRLLRSTNKL